jgi:hypothetical protein
MGNMIWIYITAICALIYLIYRIMNARRSKRNSDESYDDIINDAKYKVKGRFEA